MKSVNSKSNLEFMSVAGTAPIMKLELIGQLLLMILLCFIIGQHLNIRITVMLQLCTRFNVALCFTGDDGTTEWTMQGFCSLAKAKIKSECFIVAEGSMSVIGILKIKHLRTRESGDC